MTVTLPRPNGVEALLPPGGQAALDLAAAAIQRGADGVELQAVCGVHDRESAVHGRRSRSGARVARVLAAAKGWHQ